MRNISKFIGSALLIAGASFAFASCSKEANLNVEEPVVKQEIDAEGTAAFTKCSEEFQTYVNENFAEIKEAIDTIASCIARQHKLEAIAVDEFQEDLFDLFTGYFDEHNYDNYSFDTKKPFGIFNLLSSVYFELNNSNVNDGDGSDNDTYVVFDFDNNTLSLQTASGYAIEAYLPSMWIKLGAHNIIDADLYGPEFNGSLWFHLVKYTSPENKRCLAHAQICYDADDYTHNIKIGYVDVSIYDKADKDVAGFYYEFNKFTGKPIADSFWAWYSNADSYNNGTTIVMRNFESIALAVEKINNLSGSYNLNYADACAIANLFNYNVFGDASQYYTLEITSPAILAGHELKAVVEDNGSDSFKYWTVVIKWGNVVVDSLEFHAMLLKYCAEIHGIDSSDWYPEQTI